MLGSGGHRNETLPPYPEYNPAPATLRACLTRPGDFIILASTLLPSHHPSSRWSNTPCTFLTQSFSLTVFSARNSLLPDLGIIGSIAALRSQRRTRAREACPAMHSTAAPPRALLYHLAALSIFLFVCSFIAWSLSTAGFPAPSMVPGAQQVLHKCILMNE